MFDVFYLPDSAELYIYNEEKTMISGPITSEYNQKTEKFATDLIQGNSIIVELFEPESHFGETKLHISKVVHGYKNLFDKSGFGSSGSCNNDINCPEGNAWQNESDAVAMIIVNNNRICSGVLVNNGCQDYTPSFLTAFHCLDANQNGTLEGNEITQVQNNWVFRFQYKSPSCNGPDDVSFYSFSGSTFRAAWSTSDFALLELNQRPHGNTGIKLAGWNRGTAAATSSVGIHHPSGDVMKISFDNQAPQIDGYLGGGGTNYWRVNWDDGTTEGGSSGSPLFDQNHRIVGQLRGGFASCPSTDERDWYGRFSSSWNGGGAANTRLSTWLTNNPGVTQTATVPIPYITGDFVVCNTSKYFTVQNFPTFTHMVSWTVTSNLQIIGSRTNPTVEVRYSGTQPGAGTVTARIRRNDTACPNTTNFTFNVQAGPFNTGQITVSGQAAVCPGNAYNYTANVPGGHASGYTYNWSFPSGWSVFSQSTNTIRLFVPTNNPQYGAVRVSVNNGCGASGLTGITVFPGFCGSSFFTIAPNPATDEVTVQFEVGGDYEIALLDKNGTEVSKATIKSDQFTLNVAKYPKGTYYLKAVGKNREGTERILIE